MRPEQLWQNYPVLYHMAEPETWPSIRKRGLLSTSALLDLFEVPPAVRRQLEATLRPELTHLTHRRHGRITIRDQKPMHLQGLKRALAGSGLAPGQWLRLLNGRVYFWLSAERLTTLLNARAYRGRVHTVLTIDTETLVRKYEPQIELSAMNTGSTRPVAHPRGRGTFLPIRSYPFDQRRRDGRTPVVELTVKHSVPDIARYVRRVEHRKGDQVIDVLLAR